MEEEAQQEERIEKTKLLKQYKALVITLGILIILVGISTLTLVIYTWDRGYIVNGVVLSEIPLGQLNIEDARAKLEETKENLLSRPIRFTAEGETFSINLGELGLTYTYDLALQQAYLIGREGSLFEKAYSKIKAGSGINFDSLYQWNDTLITETLTKNLSTLNVRSEDAYFTISTDSGLEIVPEKPGRQVDIQSLVTSVKQLSLSQPESIPIPFQITSPVLTQKDLEDLKAAALLGSYTTHFDPNLIGRTQNIRLAAKAINGKILKPGEEFSFNETVGQRSVQAGYQIATIIVGKKFVPGLGGGVCQVSSTLYNAVRLAALEVTERSHHSLEVTYVPPGQDATVAYPDVDFKFRNDSGGYLLIHSKVDHDTVTFSLYGNWNP